MKATFSFNVQIDGYRSVVTMDSENIKDLDVDTLVTVGKLFQGIQTRVSQTLEKLYNDKMVNTKESTAMVEESQELPAPPAEVQVEDPETESEQ